MNTIHYISEQIKTMIAMDEKNKGINRKIKDKDVADILGINAQNLATAKSREPGKELLLKILEFCAKRGININYLLFNQSLESQEKNTNRYLVVKFGLTV